MSKGFFKNDEIQNNAEVRRRANNWTPRTEVTSSKQINPKRAQREQGYERTNLQATAFKNTGRTDKRSDQREDLSKSRSAITGNPGVHGNSRRERYKRQRSEHSALHNGDGNSEGLLPGSENSGRSGGGDSKRLKTSNLEEGGPDTNERTRQTETGGGGASQEDTYAQEEKDPVYDENSETGIAGETRENEEQIEADVLISQYYRKIQTLKKEKIQLLTKIQQQKEKRHRLLEEQQAAGARYVSEKDKIFNRRVGRRLRAR